jgi:hypothetical protein
MSTTVTSSKPKRVHTKKSTTVAGLDLKTASMQDIFDFVVFKLIQQGKQAMTSTAASITCAYLAEDGCKCGIGQIIPDGLYNPGLEGNIVKDLLRSPSSNHRGLISPTSFITQLRAWVGGDEERAEFLTGLQTAHDMAGAIDFLGVFRSSARKLAARHGLDSSIVGYREPVQVKVTSA